LHGSEGKSLGKTRLSQYLTHGVDKGKGKKDRTIQSPVGNERKHPRIKSTSRLKLRLGTKETHTSLSKSARDQRAKRPASQEVSSILSQPKYQSTRYSHLSVFGLLFQKYEICEICKVFAIIKTVNGYG
jgi:hypothetical protein